MKIIVLYPCHYSSKSPSYKLFGIWGIHTVLLFEFLDRQYCELIKACGEKERGNKKYKIGRNTQVPKIDIDLIFSSGYLKSTSK